MTSSSFKGPGERKIDQKLKKHVGKRNGAMGEGRVKKSEEKKLLTSIAISF